MSPAGAAAVAFCLNLEQLFLSFMSEWTGIHVVGPLLTDFDKSI